MIVVRSLLTQWFAGHGPTRAAAAVRLLPLLGSEIWAHKAFLQLTGHRSIPSDIRLIARKALLECFACEEGEGHEELKRYAEGLSAYSLYSATANRLSDE